MTSSWQRFRSKAARVAPLVALALVVTASLYQALCHTEAFADDAAITFAYSRQLAATGEFLHTASSERVEGFSNPTWTVLCALPFLLHMDPYIFARTMGVLSLLFTVVLIYRTSLRLFGSRASHFAPPLLMGMAPCVCFWAMAGLETPLIWLLIAAAIHQSLREELDGARQWSGAILAALALSRPEGLIYAAPIAIYKGIRLFVRPLDERRAAIARHMANLLWLVAPVAAFVVWRRLYFSEWLPNTYYAKLTSFRLLALDGSDEERGVRYVTGFFDMYKLWPLVYATPAALFVRRRWAEAVLVLLMVGAHLAYVLIVDGDWMGDFRFFAYAMPAYALLLGMVIQGCADLLSRLPERWWRRAKGVVEQTVAAVLLALFLVFSLVPTLTDYERAGWVSMLLVRQQGVGLELIARRSGLLRASAAVPDVGGSAMDTDLMIIDTVGLTDPVFARLKARPGRVRQYFFEEARPDFYQAHSHWRRYYNLPLHAEFERDYVPLHEPLTKRLGLIGDNAMRREHLTASLGEVEHRVEVELGRGLILRGYDDPIAVDRQLLIRLYVESDGQTPIRGDQLFLARRAGDEVDEAAASLDLTALPPGLFRRGDLLRLRLKARAGPLDAIDVRRLSGDDTGQWFTVSTVAAGQRRGADLDRFVLYPRTHFVCAIESMRGEGRQLTARGRLQIFDDCRPVHRPDEVDRLTRELVDRAGAALRHGLPRVAAALLGRAELLQPTSHALRRAQRRAALACYREALAAARRGELVTAQRLAVDALGAEPLLSQARAFSLDLIERDLGDTPDLRARFDAAIDRVRAAPPTRAALRELLRAALDADHTRAAARILDEVGVDLIEDDELRTLAGQTFLAIGLCERALEVAGPARARESCHLTRLRSQAVQVCGQDASDVPSCGRPLRLSTRRSVFELEGEEGLAGWDVDGRIVEPDERPTDYVSGFAGAGLIRTDWAEGGIYRALSPELELDQDALSVQVGGGSLDDGVAVELLVGGRVVRRGAGQRDHHLRRLTWDVSDLVGRRARLRVVDQGRGDWGFIYVDHVRTHPRFYFDAAQPPP